MGDAGEWADEPPPDIWFGKPHSGVPRERSRPWEALAMPDSTDVPDDGEPPAVGLTATYGKALRDLKLDQTPEGMLVLQLAYLLEFSEESISSKASIAGRLMEAWKLIQAKPSKKKDDIDEIAEARRKRFGG